MKSNWNNDIKDSVYVADFLDDYFYTPEGVLFERVSDMNLQMKGIDVIVTSPSGKKINIDEKAQLTKLGCPTPSFSFELSYLKNNLRKTGWFYDKNNLTDFYLLFYPKEMHNGIVNQSQLSSKDDFKEVDIVLVSKVSIQNFLLSKGYSLEYLLNESVKLMNAVNQNLDDNAIQSLGYEKRATGYRKVLEHGISVFYTTFLAEKPLNIIISRKFLDTLAHKVIQLSC